MVNSLDYLSELLSYSAKHRKIVLAITPILQPVLLPENGVIVVFLFLLIPSLFCIQLLLTAFPRQYFLGSKSWWDNHNPTNVKAIESVKEGSWNSLEKSVLVLGGSDGKGLAG